MTVLDPVLLSRLQFVWVIALHILLPAFTVGLASYIAVLEILHLATARAIGTVFLLPIILMYTTWSYWVFRGKVRAGLGYH
jgi:membrane protein YdbS with pleckstrin-like domain